MNEYKLIPGYEPYEISRCGKLRLKGKILTTPSMKNGYRRKYLKALKRNLLIHRAIALAFISNPNNLLEVNHIDGNKSNNNISNLEWVSRSQNAKHAFINGLMKDQNGEAGPRAILKNVDIKIIREACQHGFTQREIANYYRMHQSNVSLINRKINWVNV